MIIISALDFTIGNNITVAIAIYKHNWKKYSQLSLTAHLWSFIPANGWAKYFAIAAWTCFCLFFAFPNSIDIKSWFRETIVFEIN